MSADLVSRRLRLMLADWLSANSVLREIENEFEAEGVAYKPDPSKNVGGQRRTMVHGYYNGLDFTDARDARKFLAVLSVFMRQMESYASATGETAILGRFQDQLRRDGYAYKQGTVTPITAAARLAATAAGRSPLAAAWRASSDAGARCGHSASTAAYLLWSRRRSPGRRDSAAVSPRSAWRKV